MRTLIAAAITSSILMASPAEAKRDTVPKYPNIFAGMFQTQKAVTHGRKSIRKSYRKVRHAHRVGNRRVHSVRSHSVSYTGLPFPLTAKVNELATYCNGRVISAYRSGAHIAGTRHRSLHALGQAVDMTGDISCINARLVGWPGGASTDYSRMGHIHISYSHPGGQEWGARFRHGSGSRYARHRHYHYASVARR